MLVFEGVKNFYYRVMILSVYCDKIAADRFILMVIERLRLVAKGSKENTRIFSVISRVIYQFERRRVCSFK